MNRSAIATAITTALFAAPIYAEVTPADLPAMVITADFRPGEAQDTPISLTTIDSEAIESRGAELGRPAPESTDRSASRMIRPIISTANAG